MLLHQIGGVNMNNQDDKNIEDDYLRNLEEDSLRSSHQFDYFSKNLKPYKWKRDLYAISNTFINIAYSICSTSDSKQYQAYLQTLKYLLASIILQSEFIEKHNSYERYFEFTLKSKQFIQVCKVDPYQNDQTKLYEFFERLLDTFEELPIPNSFR